MLNYKTDLRHGLKTLEKFKWIKLYDNEQFEITDEFRKIFRESFEDCNINKLESTQLREKLVEVIFQPKMTDDIWEMYKAGMTEDEIRFELETAMLAGRMLEKIGGLDNPSPNTFYALCVVLKSWHEDNTQQRKQTSK